MVDAEHSTHAAEGFSDDRAAADSPGADVWATTPLAKFKTRTASTNPAEESEGDTIASKHAAEPALTMPEASPGSPTPQAYSKGQAAENKAAAQAASSAAAAATSSPAVQNDVKSFSPPLQPQQQPQQALQMLTCQHLAQQSPCQEAMTAWQR